MSHHQSLQSGSTEDRVIKRRRKADKAKKEFVCWCGKRYYRNESLYVHQKTKHNEIAKLKKIQINNTNQSLIEVEKEEKVKKVFVNNETFNLLTKSSFLNFFKEIKEFSNQQQEILKLFLTEQKGFTILNMSFLESGNLRFLNYLIKAMDILDNVADTQHSRMLNKQDTQFQNNNPQNLPQDISTQTNNHLYNPQDLDQSYVPTMNGILGGIDIPESYQGIDVIDFGFDGSIKDPEFFMNLKEQTQQDPTLNSITMSQTIMYQNINEQEKCEKIPEYYRDFFTIAYEMIKPMTKNFAMEMCYLFNKLIEMSSQQINTNIKEYKEKNYIILLELIQQEQNLFPEFNSLLKINREVFIEKFLFNLANIFSTAESAHKP